MNQCTKCVRLIVDYRAIKKVCILSASKRVEAKYGISPIAETYLAVSSTQFQKCMTKLLGAVPASNVPEWDFADEEVLLGQYIFQLNLFEADGWKVL